MTSPMEFDLGEDLTALADLAGEIFADQAPVDRVVAVERTEGGFDAKLWQTLADAGLLAAVLPEAAGGGEMGLLGLVAIAEQQGRRLAPVPFVAVVAGAAMPIAEFGSDALRARYLEPLTTGQALVTSGFDGVAGDCGLHGRLDGDAVILDGRVLAVPAAEQASAAVLPVRLADGSQRVVVVDLDAEGVRREPVATTFRGAAAHLELTGVRVAADSVLGGEEVVAWTLQRLRLGLAGVQIGVCAQALETTAQYVSQREQFGRPISTNQAVAVRAADAYLDTESIRLTTTRAAWLLDTGRAEEAAAAVLVAKLWAARGGLRAVHATQHLHGGIGADIDYPIHRYFLWGRQLAFSLGGADQIAAELGASIESAPRIGAPA
ncbi:acyl-CoA dehydrogenase family protein [Nocardioides dubius]|uniref:Acyl-CoA dehydrogenase family protein n=1 Tax=Nocardioides dubius TaxID=317019 RepID=A0ABN1TVH1_9ACTN